MLLLAACVVAGFGITYLSQVELNLEERIAFGTVLGAMAVATVSFVLSMAVRDVTFLTVLIAMVATTAAALAILVLNRAHLVADLGDARARWTRPLRSVGHPWPLLGIFLLCAAWALPFFSNAYQYRPDGLYTGYVNIWGDWAAHLSFTGSFAYGHNFPPEFPIDPGNHLGYPFMMDFLAANLVPLGTSLTSSLVLTSGLLSLVFPAVMYLAASRFAGGRAAGAIATIVFLMSGGIGFVYLLGDMAARGLGVLSHLPREYTLDRELNFQWLNPVLAYLVPQRTTLLGFSLALIVLLLVWTATREELGWPAYLFAGLVAGLMPAFGDKGDVYHDFRGGASGSRSSYPRSCSPRRCSCGCGRPRTTATAAAAAASSATASSRAGWRTRTSSATACCGRCRTSCGSGSRTRRC